MRFIKTPWKILLYHQKLIKVKQGGEKFLIICDLEKLKNTFNSKNLEKNVEKKKISFISTEILKIYRHQQKKRKKQKII